MPSFEGGGVEKNIILIANYFVKKNPYISNMDEKTQLEVRKFLKKFWKRLSKCNRHLRSSCNCYWRRLI